MKKAPTWEERKKQLIESNKSESEVKQEFDLWKTNSEQLISDIEEWLNESI